MRLKIFALRCPYSILFVVVYFQIKLRMPRSSLLWVSEYYLNLSVMIRWLFHSNITPRYGFIPRIINRLCSVPFRFLSSKPLCGSYAPQVALARVKALSVRRWCRSMATHTCHQETCCVPRLRPALRGANSYRPSCKRENWCLWWDESKKHPGNTFDNLTFQRGFLYLVLNVDLLALFHDTIMQ